MCPLLLLNLSSSLLDVVPNPDSNSKIHIYTSNIDLVLSMHVFGVINFREIDKLSDLINKFNDNGQINKSVVTYYTISYLIGGSRDLWDI